MSAIRQPVSFCTRSANSSASRLVCHLSTGIARPRSRTELRTRRESWLLSEMSRSPKSRRCRWTTSISNALVGTVWWCSTATGSRWPMVRRCNIVKRPLIALVPEQSPGFFLDGKAGFGCVFQSRLVTSPDTFLELVGNDGIQNDDTSAGMASASKPGLKSPASRLMHPVEGCTPPPSNPSALHGAQSRQRASADYGDLNGLRILLTI